MAHLAFDHTSLDIFFALVDGCHVVDLGLLNNSGVSGTGGVMSIGGDAATNMLDARQVLSGAKIATGDDGSAGDLFGRGLAPQMSLRGRTGDCPAPLLICLT